MKTQRIIDAHVHIGRSLNFDMKETKFYLITDPHYFASSLGCSGKEYDDFMHYEQKCAAELRTAVFGCIRKQSGYGRFRE